MKLYLAGPDVFRPDAAAWAERARALCAARGHQALLPIDSPAVTAAAIFAANLAMIRAADAVLACADPFRGVEPDSGTCFEIGYAHALGKPVIIYLQTLQPLVARVAACLPGTLRSEEGCTVDADGMLVEDFGLPLNLMLAVPCHLAQGGLEQALTTLESLT